MARTEWLNQLLGGISGAGKGLELQQQYRRQREQDVQAKEVHQAQMDNLQSEASSRRLRDLVESRQAGIVPITQPGTVQYGQQQIDDTTAYDPSVTPEGHRLTEIQGAFPTLSPAMQKLVAARPELIPHIQGGAFTKPETQPQRHYDTERGVFVNPDGTFTAIPGLPRRPVKDPVARYSPITTTDAQGNQHVSRFNNLTGEIEDTGVTARQGGVRSGTISTPYRRGEFVNKQLSDVIGRMRDANRTMDNHPLKSARTAADSATYTSAARTLPGLQQTADSLRGVLSKIGGDLSASPVPSPSSPPSSSIPAHPAATTIQSQDEYDHLRRVVGMTDAQIAQRYTIPQGITRGQ